MASLELASKVGEVKDDWANDRGVHTKANRRIALGTTRGREKITM